MPPGSQGVASAPYPEARVVRNTSVVPLPSPGTMFEASDWNATARAMRPSCEITPLVLGPLGSPPSAARESRKVS